MGHRFTKDAANEQEQPIDIEANINEHIDNFSAYLAQSTHGTWDADRFNNFQRPIVFNIIKDIVNGHNVILQGATGTGKSIIAMFCATYFTSYILTSDKMLQDQYAKFIQTYLYDNKIKQQQGTLIYRDCTVLKGRDNYMCNVNKLPFSQGVCQQDGLSIAQAAKLPCAMNCAYLNTRAAAIVGNCAILNYAYWLIQLNIVKGKFAARELTIFDECHKIDDILSNFLDTTIGPRFIQNCTKAESLIAAILTHENQQEYVEVRDKLFNEIRDIIQLATTAYNIEDMRAKCCSLSSYLISMTTVLNDAYDKLFTLLESGVKLDMFQKAFIKFVSACSTLAYSIDSMLGATKDNPADMIIVLDTSSNSLQFKCVNDKLLANTLIHQEHVTNAQLWMSATIGDIDTFAECNGITNYTSYYFEPDWNFDRSPVILCKPALSLNYKNKAENLPKLVVKIDEILDKHDCNCIIHTSTRDITSYILRNSRHSSRMLTYNNAIEKRTQIDIMKRSKNAVLVGYSITEGVDLPDDLCRCQIIAKLPWMSLGDIVIKTKASNHDNWYRNKCYQSFVQSIGRGIRHQDDWCVTYVIDDSINRLMPYIKHNEKLLNRLQSEQVAAVSADIQDDDFFAAYK